MVLVQRHKMIRNIYVGGSIHPLLQIASQAGTAILPHIGRSNAKKILLGLLSGVGSAMLAKALDKGRQYMSQTLSNKINIGTPMNSVLEKLLNISSKLKNVGDPNPNFVGNVKAIDREMVPIKNQLMAQTADINITEAPLRKVAKKFENLSMVNNVTGYGMKSQPKKGGASYGINQPHLNNALNKRADMLLRNILN